MGGFAVEDLFLKILSEAVPVSQILIYVGISATVLLSVISIIKRIPVLRNDIYSNKLFIIRSFADMMGAVLIVTSISLMPLSTVSSILQALPLFITFGAVLIFKESVGWRRWSAVSFGFIGVILILKPGLSSFNPSSLIVLLAVACLALRDIVTRKISKDIHSITVSLYAFILTTVGGIFSLPFFGNFVTLTITQWFVVLTITLFGCFSYFMLVLATRKGDISVISPFRYSRLIFAIVLAILVLNERPDTLTLVGAAIIVASGYYTIWRERSLTLK
jgi:drug/metabolite transporter (DMT)-like permease